MLSAIQYKLLKVNTIVQYKKKIEVSLKCAACIPTFRHLEAAFTDIQCLHGLQIDKDTEKCWMPATLSSVFGVHRLNRIPVYLLALTICTPFTKG